MTTGNIEKLQGYTTYDPGIDEASVTVPERANLTSAIDNQLTHQTRRRYSQYVRAAGLLASAVAGRFIPVVGFADLLWKLAVGINAASGLAEEGLTIKERRDQGIKNPYSDLARGDQAAHFALETSSRMLGKVFTTISAATAVAQIYPVAIGTGVLAAIFEFGVPWIQKKIHRNQSQGAVLAAS